MTYWAGVDIGNSTTEVVLCLVDGLAATVVDAARAPTRGIKGSHRSGVAAATLLRRMVERHDVELARVVLAPPLPVESAINVVTASRPHIGRLRAYSPNASTAGGHGSGVGRPVTVRGLLSRPGGPLVVLAGEADGYRDVAKAINLAWDSGVNVVAVIAVRDEGVLIANRLHHEVPVLDEAPVDAFADSEIVALECQPPGTPIGRLDDPFWLAVSLGLSNHEIDHARTAAGMLADSSCGVVFLGAPAPPAESPSPCPDDAFVVRLADIATDARMRRGVVNTDAVLTAQLSDGAGGSSAIDGLLEILEIPIVLGESEAAAAQAGALSTPGCHADAAVVDIGGGTVDVMHGEDRVVLAGAGDLLTSAIATTLRISKSLSEHAKRSEAVMAVAPQIVEDERGRRRFLDAPLGGSCLGSLCTPTPTGLLAFTSGLSASEWRALRQTAKQSILGRNISDGARRLSAEYSSVVLVGGGAGDVELANLVSREVGEHVTVGRANVGGSLGHRHAVAFGLVKEELKNGAMG